MKEWQVLSSDPDRPIFDDEVELPNGNIGLKEIVNETTERGRILHDFYDVLGLDVWKLSPEVQEEVKQLEEDHINIIDNYDDFGKERYIIFIDAVKKDHIEREKLIKHLNETIDHIGKAQIASYCRLASLDGEDDHERMVDDLLLYNFSNMKIGNFLFVNDLNMQELEEFERKLIALDVTEEKVSALQDIVSKQKAEMTKRSDQRDRKELQKSLGREDNRFLKKIANVIWTEKDCGTLNVRGLTIEELRELDHARKEIDILMCDYGLDRYSMSDDDWKQIVEEFSKDQ